MNRCLRRRRRKWLGQSVRVCVSMYLVRMGPLVVSSMWRDTFSGKRQVQPSRQRCSSQWGFVYQEILAWRLFRWMCQRLRVSRIGQRRTASFISLSGLRCPLQGKWCWRWWALCGLSESCCQPKVMKADIPLTDTNVGRRPLKSHRKQLWKC